ncbi:MAG: hypothetical protein RIR70_9 [Pseudomonadota bacterium]|jgi:hypothetical protein
MSAYPISYLPTDYTTYGAVPPAAGVDPIQLQAGYALQDSGGLGGSVYAGQAGHAVTLNLAVAAADPTKVAGWAAGQQAYPVNPAVLASVNQAVDAAASTPLQRAWLMAHITGESADLQGAANGDGKSGGAYNVSPYNINIHMIQEAARQAVSFGDPHGIAQFAAMPEEAIKGISTFDASRVMVASLEMWGFNKTEAFIRAGGTGYLAMEALEKGGITPEQAAQQWQSVTDGKFVGDDMATWLRGVAQRTAAIAQDPNLQTGQVQVRNPLNGI